MNKPIERAIAKEEIERINEILERPHLLIGGLAVQQYYSARISKDIDLVCDFDTTQVILDSLYPSKDWIVTDCRNDEYRPSFQIKHKFHDKGTIIFGPKIIERKPYSFIDWEELMKESEPFKAKDNKILKNICVLTPHALAYTKLISFIGRTTVENKVKQDLKDFVDLTNHGRFSSSKFYDLLRKSGDENQLINDFRRKSSKYKDIISGSCLGFLTNLFIEDISKKSRPRIKNSRNIGKSTIYLAGPHNNIMKNKRIANSLRDIGFELKVPYEEVSSRRLTEGINNASKIREVCIESIVASDIIVVDLDNYGLDTAWEIGYAEGLGKLVIGINEDPNLTSDDRFINRKEYSENFMHGWSEQRVLDNRDELLKLCTDKTVYISGSFSNPEVNRLSMLKDEIPKLIVPKDYVSGDIKLPKGYPLTSRIETNKLLKSADIILVLLPRYGMDTSWQIGYATALNKEIIGYLLKDDERQLVKQTFWEHWMHGWKQKIHVIGVNQLAGIIQGLELAGIIEPRMKGTSKHS